MTKEKILNRLNGILDEFDELEDIVEGKPVFLDVEDGIIASMNEAERRYNSIIVRVDSLFLSFLPKTHPYYKSLKKDLITFSYHYVGVLKDIIIGVRDDVRDGFVEDIKKKLSAEIFSDFIGQAEYLLGIKLYHPAAVLIGSVIEKELKDLCNRNGIPVMNFDSRKQKNVYVPADKLNELLVKAGVYNVTQQKIITGHLGVRNSAAHGLFEQYKRSDVDAMLVFAKNFISDN